MKMRLKKPEVKAVYIEEAPIYFSNIFISFYGTGLFYPSRVPAKVQNFFGSVSHKWGSYQTQKINIWKINWDLFLDMSICRPCSHWDQFITIHNITSDMTHRVYMYKVVSHLISVGTLVSGFLAPLPLQSSYNLCEVPRGTSRWKSQICVTLVTLEYVTDQILLSAWISHPFK